SYAGHTHDHGALLACFPGLALVDSTGTALLDPLACRAVASDLTDGGFAVLDGQKQLQLWPTTLNTQFPPTTFSLRGLDLTEPDRDVQLLHDGQTRLLDPGGELWALVSDRGGQGYTIFRVVLDPEQAVAQAEVVQRIEPGSHSGRARLYLDNFVL